MTHTAQYSETPASELTVISQAGAVRGALVNDVAVFWGVPYAAPPVGDLRFALPRPPTPWQGVRDAMRKGPVAPQPIASKAEMEKALPGLNIEPLIGGEMIFGDDFLLANIWSPDVGGSAPVMVFIHGGAFTGGAGSADVYDGTAFARAGVVCVTINYRLGIEGFLPIPGAPTNLGLRDQLAALAWVQDNIAAFGGDANNVTVFGESAGAMSIANLVASPLAKGSFKRAIVQSGHGDMVRPIPVARRLVTKLAKMLRVPATVDGFKSRTISDAMAVQKKASLPATRVDLRNPDKREPAFGLSKFLPVYGDDVLPQHPVVALKNGVGAEIELIVGTNSEEMNLYFVPSGVRRKIGKFLANFAVGQAEPKAREILKAYGINDKVKRPGDAFTEALTDLVFRLPARKFAAAHKGKTWVYDFSWRSTAYDGALGACHAIELPFVFDTLSTVSGRSGLAGENPPQALATHMNKLWVDFAKAGVVPWPEYNGVERQVHTPNTGVTVSEPPFKAEAFLPF
ncbi:carboxylesterase/lipase family protein [Terricaulis sp.]|uniref:carboxylesterase/lipase family protein n=1 Tax=Terricaulis sp. TaxID=2768686 RepID=UPI003783CA13